MYGVGPYAVGGYGYVSADIDHDPKVTWSSEQVTWAGVDVLWGAPFHPRDFAVIVDGSSVNLSWSEFYDYDLYIIERQSLDNETWSHDKFIETTGTSTTDAIGAGTYRYRIKAARTIA